MISLSHLAATVGAVTTLAGAGAYVAEPHVDAYLTERFATVEQVAGNSKAILIVQIENAIRSGDRGQLIRLCNNFVLTYGQKPSGCP